MEKKKILAIIPAYNEAKSIAQLIHEIKKNCPDIQPLVVNDGSSDNTLEAAETAGSAVAPLPFNLGIGGAVQTGYKIARQEDYDIAIQIDGDGQHDPAFIQQLLNPILNNQLDFCIGSRFATGQSGFKSTFLRRFGIRFFAWLLRQLTGVNLTDPTSGFRAINKKLIGHFADYYPVDFPEPEAIKIAKRFGARIGEVPVQMRERFDGKSSIRYFSTIYYMIKVTLALLIDTLKEKK